MDEQEIPQKWMDTFLRLTKNLRRKSGKDRGKQRQVLPTFLSVQREMFLPLVSAARAFPNCSREQFKHQRKLEGRHRIGADKPIVIISAYFVRHFS